MCVFIESQIISRRDIVALLPTGLSQITFPIILNFWNFIRKCGWKNIIYPSIQIIIFEILFR